MADYDICTRNKSGKVKTRQMLEANKMKVRRKIKKNKKDRIRSQQMRESCRIQLTTEGVKEEEEDNGTNM